MIYQSQSLWVRDRFLIKAQSLTIGNHVSQSLWVRDRFLIDATANAAGPADVAIPLGQGQVFNLTGFPVAMTGLCRNPFGSGTGF